MGWVTMHHPQRIDLDSCVTCGLCLPVCPTYRLTGDETASPRGRLTAIAAVDQGLAVVDERFAEIVDFCLQCRACESACPSLVPYGKIIESATAEVAAQRPSTVSLVRRFAVTTAVAAPSLLRSSAVAIGLAQRIGIPTRGLRKIPFPNPTVRGGSWGSMDGPVVALFVGCVADAWFSDLHRATIEVLVAAGYRVEAPKSQTCCGALASHEGLVDEAERLAFPNREALRSADLIVVDVAGCGAHLKADPEFGDRVRDVTQVVAAAISDGRLESASANGHSVVVQDPCHLEHGQGIVDEPRIVLNAAGYEVLELGHGGLCCGAAGTYLIDHADTSAQLGEMKAAAVRAVDATIVSSANAGCEMQLRRFLGAGYEVRHPVELYADTLRRN